MTLVTQYVVPVIDNEWEEVCERLEYSAAIKNLISRTNKGLPRECCRALLEDWVTTDNGVKPKTWEKLIEVLSEISSLAMVTKQIKQCLYQEGVLGGNFYVRVLDQICNKSNLYSHIQFTSLMKCCIA